MILSELHIATRSTVTRRIFKGSEVKRREIREKRREEKIIYVMLVLFSAAEKIREEKREYKRREKREE